MTSSRGLLGLHLQVQVRRRPQRIRLRDLGRAREGNLRDGKGVVGTGVGVNAGLREVDDAGDLPGAVEPQRRNILQLQDLLFPQIIPHLINYLFITTFLIK